MCHVQLIENRELELFMLVIIAGHKMFTIEPYLFSCLDIYCPIDRSPEVINALIQDAKVLQFTDDDMNVKVRPLSSLSFE